MAKSKKGRGFSHLVDARIWCDAEPERVVLAVKARASGLVRAARVVVLACRSAADTIAPESSLVVVHQGEHRCLGFVRLRGQHRRIRLQKTRTPSVVSYSIYEYAVQSFSWQITGSTPLK